MFDLLGKILLGLFVAGAVGAAAVIINTNYSKCVK